MANCTQINLRTLKSRNQREGWYAGKHREFQPDKNWYDQKVRHFRDKLFWKSLKGDKQ